MKFRRILFLILCGLLLMPAPSTAKDKFVAVIITGDLLRYKQANEAFMKILAAGGLTKDKVEVYVQTPNPDAVSWANSIRKAVGVGADLIITYGAPATLVAKKEARSLPILFADVYDPVGLGIVKDLNVPGGDISGVSNKTPVETLLKAFSEICPGKTIGALYSEADAGAVLQLADMEKAAGTFGVKVLRKSVANAKDVGAAANELAGKSGSLFVADSAILQQKLPEIMDAANQHRIPVISQIPGLGDLGGLITLEADPSEQGQLVGVHTLQILVGGQKALSLPVRTPKKVALIINFKVAKELGLTVPFDTLGVATRVIK